MWTLISLLMFVLKRSDGLEPTDRLIPSGYVGNPWGPDANRARAEGVLPPIVCSDSMNQWRRWGKQVLREGDIVFRRADARILHGFFPFSRFLANVTGSKFSHTAIVTIKDGEPWVYDTTAGGPRLQPFYVWILDNVGEFGVKRIRPDLRSHIVQTVDFCREIYERQAVFDWELGPDDRAYYCVELTEKAYRASGLVLSEPVLIGDMENISQFPICTFMFLTFSPLKIDQPIYCPGNERHGIWGSAALEQIYPPKPKVAGKTKLPARSASIERSGVEAQRSQASARSERDDQAEVPPIPPPAVPPSNAPRPARAAAPISLHGSESRPRTALGL